MTKAVGSMNIKELRGQLGLTQEELANLLHVDLVTMAKWETTSNPAVITAHNITVLAGTTTEMMERLADALDVTNWRLYVRQWQEREGITRAMGRTATDSAETP